MDTPALTVAIRHWAKELGFHRIGFAGVALHEDERRLLNWLDQGRHGEMHYMASHGTRRSRPPELVANTISVISVSMDYSPPLTADPWEVLGDSTRAYISRYALGRDYHKLMRKRLQRLAVRIQAAVGQFGYRAFVDSAPVLEKALARNAGLGWIGKHTNLLHREAGSWFFLGELYTDLPLLPSLPASDHCGHCQACIDICPTQAIVAPYELDARRCISYLTIELKGSIPLPLRALIGNRIFGCDDCQLVCPWNRFAQPSAEPDFAVRNQLDTSDLLTLFAWSKAEFADRIRGSAIRRIGYDQWLRNLAVALGNALRSAVKNDSSSATGAIAAITAGLRARADYPSSLVQEHVHWALQQQFGDRQTEESQQ